MQLRKAARALKSHFPGARFSRCYRNAAVGFDGPDFFNFVVELPVTGEPVQLRQLLQDIEAQCGRKPDAPRWAPRAMDLDILLFGERTMNEPGLVLPRPSLLQWSFMLGPLAELAPELQHPTVGRSIAELWDAYDQQQHPLREALLDLNAF